MNKQWIITDDGEKLFYDEKSGGYVDITLSNERINHIFLEAIAEFNKNNRPSRRKRLKKDNDALFHDDDVEISLLNNDPRLNRLAEETMLADNELREFQERFED